VKKAPFLCSSGLLGTVLNVPSNPATTTVPNSARYLSIVSVLANTTPT